MRFVQLKGCLHRFCRHLATSAGAKERRIELKVEADLPKRPTTEAITSCLAVNELVSHPFEQASSCKRSGRVDNAFHRSGDDRTIPRITVDGTGGDGPPVQRWEFGRRLISGCVRRLEGAMEQPPTSDGWTRIEFPL